MSTDQQLDFIRRKIIPTWLRANHLPPSVGEVVRIRVESDYVAVLVQFPDGSRAEKTAPFCRDSSHSALIQRIADALISAVKEFKQAAAAEAFSQMVIEPEEWTAAA